MVRLLTGDFARKDADMDSERRRDGLSRALTILVTILLVSGGLCGLSIAGANSIHSFESPGALGQLALVTGLLSGVGILLSLFGIVVVSIAKAMNAAHRHRDGDAE
jgi:multisubunit Na+/H+ antiporter MnhB subunit